MPKWAYSTKTSEIKMSDKLFKYIGLSNSTKFNGYKIRYGNTILRFKFLGYNGDSDIQIVDLPQLSNKTDAIKYLKSTHLYQDPKYAEAIDKEYEKHCVVKVPQKRGRKPTVTVTIHSSTTV